MKCICYVVGFLFVHEFELENMVLYLTVECMSEDTIYSNRNCFFVRL